MEPVITASVPLLEPPGWAIAQRQLFDLLDDAWRRFARDFTGPDGRLKYNGRLTTRDGVDDFYEVFFNWPQLYLLGGADDLLAESERHWEGVTRQLTELGMLQDEYERGYDWFHQGESLLLLYFLCMADPERWRERALRFAELYVDPAHGNYDPEHRIIRRPHNGSDPHREGLSDREYYPWLPQEARMYGFPLGWILTEGETPPLESDPRLGEQMRVRMGRGDTAVNLAATGLVLNALIISGDPRYRDWIVEYVGAWRERAEACGGLLPDNVSPDGEVGGLFEGRPYGGHYGWSWPHGWHSVGHAAAVGALAAAAATGDDSYLELVRPTLDEIIARGKVMPFTEADSSLQSKWVVQLREDVHTPTLHVPFRLDDNGWFDYNPMTLPVPVASGTTATRTPTANAWNDCARPTESTGARYGRSAARRKRAMKSPGSPISPATTRTTPSASSPPPRPRCATGSRGWSSTATATSPKPTSTCGSSRTPWPPRRWYS